MKNMSNSSTSIGFLLPASTIIIHSEQAGRVASNENSKPCFSPLLPDGQTDGQTSVLSIAEVQIRHWRSWVRLYCPERSLARS